MNRRDSIGLQTIGTPKGRPQSILAYAVLSDPKGNMTHTASWHMHAISRKIHPDSSKK